MKDKADSETIRRQNRGLVLRALRDKGDLARIELGRITGLSPASITAIAGQLLADGVIKEQALPVVLKGRRGRPMVQLALNPRAASFMAVKISVDDVEMLLCDYAGRPLRQKSLIVPTYRSDASEFGKMVADEIAAFVAEVGNGAGALVRVGVAVQGLADTRRGVISWSPVFRGVDVPIAAPIERRLGVPCLLGNDANMMAEGLCARDPANYGGTTAVIFTGYGVGMGLIVDGKVFHGATGAAAEFGHVNHIPHGALCRCGKRGCVEAYAADYGILRAADKGDKTAPPPTAAISNEKMSALVARAAAGDPSALMAFATAGEALGFGIARLIALLNPDRVVVAGPGLAARAFIEPATRQAVEDGVADALRRNTQISFTTFTDDMILSGVLSALLGSADSEVFASGPLRIAAMPKRAVA